MRVAAVGLACLAFVVAGCVALEPDYPRAAVEFDENLLGTWEVFEEGHDGDAGRVVVGAREVEVFNERLNPSQGMNGTPPANGKVRAYLARPIPSDETRLEFGGYLVRVGDERYIGFQEIGKNGRYGGGLALSVPVHWFVRLRARADGDVEVDVPRNWVGWMPLVYWLDETAREGNEPPALADHSCTVSNSIDRVLAYYREHGNADGFWMDKPLRCRRVAGPTAETGSPAGPEAGGAAK